MNEMGEKSRQIPRTLVTPLTEMGKTNSEKKSDKEEELKISVFIAVIQIPIRYPNADVKQANRYRNLGFQREFQARDPGLGVTDMWVTFDTMTMDEGTRGHVQTKKSPSAED